eukprot:snap_masked-scaffold_22-processed-gene-4.48-mRNA-1 protein AED:1.00 eAED:1.00 QI:0/0/0/0/1/1/2/0/59
MYPKVIDNGNTFIYVEAKDVFRKPFLKPGFQWKETNLPSNLIMKNIFHKAKLKELSTFA